MSESDSKQAIVPPEKAVKPEGMTEEAWQRMNLVWGMIQGLENPPSERVQAVAPEDKGMQAIFIYDGRTYAGR